MEQRKGDFVKRKRRTAVKKKVKVNKPKKMENYRALCACSTHEIHAVFDPTENENDWVDISICECGQDFMSLWHKLRLIWRIITGQGPYSDQIVLNKPQAQRFAKYLNKIANCMKDTEEYIELK